MSDRVLRTVLATLQPPRGTAWHGGPTPVGALRGVTAAQAHWKPGPRRHSIWELTLHIAYWKYAVRRHLESGVMRFPRSPANFPAPPAKAAARAWAADRALLAREHRLLLRAIAALPVSRWNDIPPEGKKWTYGEMIVGILAHDVYHTGQVQMLKRLWKSRR